MGGRTNDISRSPGNRIDTYAARLLMVSFFLPMKLQVYVTGSLSIYFVARALMIKQCGSGRSYVAAFFLGSYFLILLLALLFTPHEYVKWLLKICEGRVTLFFIPFIFACAAPRFGRIIADEIVFFAYGCLAICLAGNVYFLYQHFVTGNAGSVSHVLYRGMFHGFTDIHPTYMGMYLCFTMCILLLLSPSARSGIWLKNAMLFVALLFLLALSPKTPMLALVLIFLHYMFTQRMKLYRLKWFVAGLAASLAAAWFFIPFFSQRIKETFQGIAGSGGDVGNSVDVRRIIWNMDTGLLKHYWLTGIGPGRLKSVLEQHYFFYSLMHRVPLGYFDTHSEYFFCWLSFGLAGILLLTAILIAHIRAAHSGRDHLYLYFLIITCATFFTETVLSQQRGVVFFAVFSSLFFFNALRKGSERNI